MEDSPHAQCYASLTPKGYAVADLLLANPGMDINQAVEAVELESIGGETDPEVETLHCNVSEA